MEISVLGSTWKLEERNSADDPRLKDLDGYTDHTVRLCVVDDFVDAAKDPTNCIDVAGEQKQRTMRHELIHAFLVESGLHTESEWATNEEMVDWVALQFPKLLAAFQQVGCI